MKNYTKTKIDGSVASHDIRPGKGARAGAKQPLKCKSNLTIGAITVH